MSMIASGCSSTARARPSASTRRPSASVLCTSTVLPPWMCSTSPSFVAEPEGMLSVHIKKPVTVLRQPTAPRADIVASTAAAPDMSIFIAACIGSLGLRLIPPESYMIPLPTRARCPLPCAARFGRYVSLIMHGGSELPALTPRRPSAAELGEAIDVEDLDVEAGVLADLGGQGGQAGRREVAGRRVGEVAGEHRRPRRSCGRGRCRPRRRAVGRPGRRASTTPAATCRRRTSTTRSGSGRARLLRRPPARPLPCRRPRRADSSPASACLGTARAKAAAASRSSASESWPRARANGDEVGAVTPRDDQRLAGLAVEAEGGERRPIDPELARDGALLADRDTDRPGAPAPSGRRRRDRRRGATTAPDRTS